jgi:hypothetical protein
MGAEFLRGLSENNLNPTVGHSAYYVSGVSGLFFSPLSKKKKVFLF